MRRSLSTTTLAPATIWGKSKYELNNDEVICGIKVPKGFVFDGATVLRPFWWLLPPVSCYFEATCLHDYLLSKGKNRKFADLKFQEACIKYKVSTATTNFMLVFIVGYGFIKRPRDYLW